VSAGSLDVHFWSYPALEPLGEPIPATIGPSFTNCYVGTRYLAGLAWSPDGRWVAMAGSEGQVKVLRACDFSTVLELTPETHPLCEYKQPTPPGLIAFSPSGDHLAAWWGGMVGMYRLAQ